MIEVFKLSLGCYDNFSFASCWCCYFVFVATFACFSKFAYVNGDENTDIEALPTSVNFRCQVLSLMLYSKCDVLLIIRKSFLCNLMILLVIAIIFIRGVTWACVCCKLYTLSTRLKISSDQVLSLSLSGSTTAISYLIHHQSCSILLPQSVQYA